MYAANMREDAPDDNHRRNRKGISSFTDTESSGVSSNDRSHSSVRYEPVSTTSSSPTSFAKIPPKPQRRTLPDSARDLSTSRDLPSDSDHDDDGDVAAYRDERRPLNVDRRMSSPVLSDNRVTSAQHVMAGRAGPRRGSSYIARAYSGNIHPPTSGGHLRMGSALAPIPASSSPPTNHHQSISDHQRQMPPPSVMTSRISASSSAVDSEQYDPVVTTTLKPTYEVDETGLWNFSKGNSRATTFGGYTGGIPTAAVPPHTQQPPARFANNRPSYAAGGRAHYRHHQYDTSMDKLRARCSWKYTALGFVLSTLIFAALAAIMLVRSISKDPIVEIVEHERVECQTSVEKFWPDDPPPVADAEPSVELQLARRKRFLIDPESFSRMQIYVEQSNNIKFNCSIGAQADMALYGRKGLKPTHTKYDFVRIFDAGSVPPTSSQSRVKRSVGVESKNSINVGFMEQLDAGTWYLAVYNAGASRQHFDIATTETDDLTSCPNACSNNGDCQDGVCRCFPGSQGKDCSQASCAVPCQGNGVYARGRCVCFSGWKGLECGTRSDTCVDPSCSGHGKCSLSGDCVCDPGYKGESCEQVDCTDPTCSGHGKCVDGQCLCDRGWAGSECGNEDEICTHRCTEHGVYDDVTQRCVCEAGWGGSECATDTRTTTTTASTPSAATCRPACAHGACVDGACRCEGGWTGDACDARQCDARCQLHGSCAEGVCVCDVGWNGDVCTFEGCVNDCSNHGNCVRNINGDWHCSCRTGWKGTSCQIKVEVRCDDAHDNDLDGLVDCQDPDCCSHRSCSRSVQCRGSSDPKLEIARINSYAPLPNTAFFYDRVRFLVQPNGVQSNAVPSHIDKRRASVIRGRVFTYDGFPLIGVEVRIDQHEDYGTTKTRADGWYDMLVNGGGSLTLVFQRASFVEVRQTTFARWSEFTVASDVVMRTPSQPTEPSANQLMHDAGNACDVSRFPAPVAHVLVSTVRAYTEADCAERGSIIPEIQAIRESARLPTTDVSLVYLSSRMPGYKSVIDILLVDGKAPGNLVRVFLRVNAEGRMFDSRFEPGDDLKYTFEWDRENTYGQKVYGEVTATVKVGYQYERCTEISWKTIVTKLAGHDPSVASPFGRWTLDLHHTYFPDRGTVYLGGGGQMRLQEQPPVMSTVMGDGNSRHETCDRCNGPASSARLLSPVALARDAIGNLFIGDHNFIRKMAVDGNVTSVFSMINPPSGKYYMAMSPGEDGQLYFSHPQDRRIYKLRQLSFSSSRRHHSLASNYIVVAGTGSACLPLQKDECGDGGPATLASLTGPKGLSFDRDGKLYFIDGTRVRIIDPVTDVISTLAGSLSATGTRPIPCTGSVSLDQLELNFPSDVTISPTDDVMYVLDGDVVIQISLNSRQAELLAGVPVQCMRQVVKRPDNRAAKKVSLVSPTSISVSPRDGVLYIAESDRKSVHRIRRVDPYSGRISTVAGADSKCDCAMEDCPCYSGDGDFARSASLNLPSAIVCMADGSVLVADQLNLRIRKVKHSMPLLSKSGEYNVPDPDTNQMYVFNEEGRHVKTSNVITGATVYTFTYTSTGSLQTISDVNGNNLNVDYNAANPLRISLPSQTELDLTFDRSGSLTRISTIDGSALISATYESGEGLLATLVRGRYSAAFHVYDARGRLIATTSPTGTMTSLHASSNATWQTVTMQTSAVSRGNEEDHVSAVGVGRRDVVIKTEPGYLCDVITTTEGAMTTTYKQWTDNSVSVRYLDGSELFIETKPHPVLGLTAPFLAKRTIQLPADPLENKIEWRTRQEPEIGSTQFVLGRRMRVNDRNILSLDYSQTRHVEKVYDDHTKFTLRVQYNARGFPSIWMPGRGINPVNITYNRLGQVLTWQRGSLTENLAYDNVGNLLSAQFSDGSTRRYTYGDKITHLTFAGTSNQYTFSYDESHNLERLTLPTGLTIAIQRRLGIGFVRTAIAIDGKTALIVDDDEKGSPLSVFYPGEKRKVVYRYDTHGHVMEIVYDAQRTRFVHDSESGELVTVTSANCDLRYQRNGPLVMRQTRSTSNPTHPLLAVFDYTYDVNLRLSSVEVAINGTKLRRENLTYNDVSGKLDTFGHYSVIDLTTHIYSIGSQIVTLSKRVDNNGRIAETQLDIHDMVLFNMRIDYDHGVRASGRNVKIGMYANDSEALYTYGREGALRAVAVNGRVKWRYSYDVDGRLVTIEYDGSLTTLRYDKFGRLLWYGDLQYHFDDDGFLRQRGNEIFEYDSTAKLIKAYRLDNLYNIEYGYDGFGRMTRRVDTLRDEIIHYMYADITNPSRITHLHNSSSGHITTYRYDLEGFVFAAERSDGVVWFVACDHMGSPLALMDKSGTFVKQIKYSPLGQVIHDTAPSAFLPIGFRGGVYDPATGLVRFANRQSLEPITEIPRIKVGNRRHTAASITSSGDIFTAGVDYDGLTGQTTSSAITKLKKVNIDGVFPFRQYQILDPVNVADGDYHMTKIASWLEELGFKLNNVAPDPQIASRQQDKSSVECQVSRHLSTYMNLETSTSSSLIPNNALSSSSLLPSETMFATGLVIGVQRGAVSSYVINSATDDVKRVANVLKGARVLIGREADTPMAATILNTDGEPIVHLYKSSDHFSKDVQTLRLTSGHKRSLQSGGSSRLSASLQDKRVTVASELSTVVIVYVRDSNSQARNDDFVRERDARDHVIVQNKERAIADAWARERRKIETGARTRWSESEKREILSRGKLASYHATYRWDADQYPELINSGRNLVFTNQSPSRR